MTCLCMDCKRVYKEKCPRAGCGSDNVSVMPGDPRVPGDPELFRCLTCRHTFRRGAGGETHGLCPECRTKRNAELTNPQ
jgi:hypothetical protein